MGRGLSAEGDGRFQDLVVSWRVLNEKVRQRRPEIEAEECVGGGGFLTPVQEAGNRV